MAVDMGTEGASVAHSKLRQLSLPFTRNKRRRRPLPESARSRIIQWMSIVREEGLEVLLDLHQGRGKKPQVKGKILTGLRQGLRRGRWKRAKEAGQ